MIKPCACGGLEFTVDAVYSATDCITLDDDGSEDFEITDTDYYDGEWEDDSRVICRNCGKIMTYSAWTKQEDQEQK